MQNQVMDDEEDAYVFVYDRRNAENTDKKKIHIGGVFSHDVFLEKILQVFDVPSDEEFVITTTGRTVINNDDSFVTLIESGDTLYLLNHSDQPLEAPVAERIEFQPHYDTLIKSGIYEYYASEGSINPLPFAFAELIDNALAATVRNKRSRYIELSLHLNSASGEHILCVHDNGEGMSSRQLNNWAIYRLSKFNRKDRDVKEHDFEDNVDDPDDGSSPTPKSLNSDISWFGVGGKQAIFFIGSSTRIITKKRNTCDVHEFTMSKDEFKRKERNREAIFAGYIRNRKCNDSSHIPPSDTVTRRFIASETDASFTRIIVSSIAESHVSFMKNGFKIWTRQLAHIYHYYIHGPEGNTSMSRKRKNIGVSDVNIMVTVYEDGQKIRSTNLRDIDDDLETKYIRTSANTFEFVAKSDGGAGGIVEGLIRYHPFLYDRETYPINADLEDQNSDSDQSGEPPARGRRPIFECYWNGRLIPYTFIDDFEWCRPPRKPSASLNDCHYRLSGCLFSNDKFQVSTNKLTFIDLDSKLRDRNTTFNHLILGEEQGGQIHRHFAEWLKDCHERHDKQIKFFKHCGVLMRNVSGSRKTPYTAYKAIEWDGKVYTKGQLIRTQRTVPVICGTIRKFLLSGEYDGDIYAVGGEIEVVQEPQSLYGGNRYYPLSKLDRAVAIETIEEILQREEGKLPASLELDWPEEDEVIEGQVSLAGVTIGLMAVRIINQDGDVIHKLHTNHETRKLLVEQRLSLTPPSGNHEDAVELSSHVTTHDKMSNFLFKKIENLKAVGQYRIIVQVALNESGMYKYGDGRNLPSRVIDFRIQESPPHKFMVGILESPLRVGCPFNIPLDMQDEFGHSTKATLDAQPLLQSDGLVLSFSGTEVKGNSLIIKDVVATGNVMSQQGKNFQMTVSVPCLAMGSQTLKIRLLPGDPHSLVLSTFNDGYNSINIQKDDTEQLKSLSFENSSEISMHVGVVDVAGNPTLRSRLIVQCKFSGSPGLPTWTCNCSQGGSGVLAGKIKLKKYKKEQFIRAKIDVQGSKEILPLECRFLVKPSTKICSINVFYRNPSLSDADDPVKLKRGQDIYWEAGETLGGLSFQLLDEVKRVVEVDDKLASKIRVNWTGSVPVEHLKNSCLPDIIIPTNVSESRFCQVAFAGEKTVDFSFNIKPLAGEPAGIKVTIHGERETRIGLIRRTPISVALLDSFGNQLTVRPDQLEFVGVSADGLDESLLSKSIEENLIVISNIQFNQGPLGSKELVVSYSNDIKEFAVLQLVAGTPVTLQVTAWGDEPLPVLSGTRIPDQIKVQLLDGWGNPSPENGVKVLLGKDPGLKLSPASGVEKTNMEGSATFPRFSLSGKCGEFFLQPRAVYNRRAIEGRKLLISLLPNTETPVALRYKLLSHPNPVVVGSMWPEFQVEVLSEEESRVTANVNLCMVIWKGKPIKEKEIPSSAEWHRTVANNGCHIFRDLKASTTTGEFHAMFCVTDSPNSKTVSLFTECVSMSTKSGPPSQLLPNTEPGTPTVSNARVAINRVLIRNLKLQLKDSFGNLCGKDLDCRLSVTIQPCEQTLKSSEVPKFEGNSSRLYVALRKGEATLQNLTLQENSPGTDGAQYILHCEIGNQAIDIRPYMLKFLFYNDSKKHAEMSALARQRDALMHAVKMYEETFNAHKSLHNEIMQGYKEASTKKKSFVIQLQKLDLSISESCGSHDISRLVEQCSQERENLMHGNRRQCLLSEYMDVGSEVLGKIGHLALVANEDIACVLSWHMSGDMDCLVTFTSKKAKEIHKLTGGTQQVLPLDSIYRKNLSDWKKSLPHVKAGISSNLITGNPIFARKLLHFPKDEANCRIIFTMLLGDTIIMDNLEAANEYRNRVVKQTHCPTILTRNGFRIRSNGKFGGNQNRAPSLDRLRGVVFGEPMPEQYAKCIKQIEILNDVRAAIDDMEASQVELESLEQETEEMKSKEREHKEAQERLKEIEEKIGFHKPIRRSLPDSNRTTRKRLKRS